MKRMLCIAPNVDIDGGRYGVFCCSAQSLFDVGTTPYLAGLAEGDHGAVTFFCDEDRTAYGILLRHLHEVVKVSTPWGEVDEQVWLYWLERAITWTQSGGVTPLLCEVPEEVKA